MTSFDVSSLFISIPQDEALTVVRDCLSEDETLEARTDLSIDQIIELVTLCLKPRISPMEVNTSYKSTAVQWDHLSLLSLQTYTWNVSSSGRWRAFPVQPLGLLTTHLSWWTRRTTPSSLTLSTAACDENIKFTQEEVQDNTLAFLDTAIHREHMQRFSEHHAARCTANPDTNKI